MSQKEKRDIPRERLLDEAEALFAEKGYTAVSVREIIAAADCNVASIHYYFGNKQNLYLEVFREEIASGKTNANTPWLELDAEAYRAFGRGESDTLPGPADRPYTSVRWSGS